MEVRPSQASEMITKCIKAKLVPMIEGSPGTGKSQIVHKIAQDYNLKVIDLRLSQCDPTDLNGFPNIVKDRACYLPMNTFPIEGDEIPKGYAGWLLFLDEFNSAPPATQAAAYKLVLDRMIGTHHLHKNVAIVCAGNKETDGAIVQPMSTALQSRLVHMELVTDMKEWLVWAAQNDVDPRITSYINFKPSQLYTFTPDHTDKTYACPRTWAFSDRILKVAEFSDPTLLPLLAGTISEGVAREFMGFCKIHENLPKLEAILKNPMGLAIPDEPSILFALTGSLSHHITEDTSDAVLSYVQRMPIEFQVICIRETVHRNRKLLGHPAVQKWVAKNAMEMF